MNKVIFTRFAYAAIPITIFSVTPSDKQNVVICLFGLCGILFSLLILPAWGVRKKYFVSKGIILRMPEVRVGARPIEYELAQAKGKGLLFEYRVGERVFLSERGWRWPLTFMPYAGKKDVRVAAEAAFRDKSPIDVFVRNDSPHIAYLTIDTDWKIVAALVVLGFSAIGLGALDWMNGI